MQVYETFESLASVPAHAVLVQIASTIRVIKISGPEEIPSVKAWLENEVSQWQDYKYLGYVVPGDESEVSESEEDEQADVSNSGSGSPGKPRRGRPPKITAAAAPANTANEQNQTTAPVAGGIDTSKNETVNNEQV